MTTNKPSVDFRDLVDGQFAKTSAEQLRAFFASLESRGTRKLVIHIHVGMVSRTQAQDFAYSLAPVYAAPSKISIPRRSVPDGGK